MTNDPQILVYLTNQLDQIVGGGPLCLHTQDQEQRKRMIMGMARPLEAGVAHPLNSDAVIVTGL